MNRIDPTGLSDEGGSYGGYFGYNNNNFDAANSDDGNDGSGGGEGGGGGGGDEGKKGPGHNPFYDDSITQMEALWNPDLAKTMGKLGYARIGDKWVSEILLNKLMNQLNTFKTMSSSPENLSAFFNEIGKHYGISYRKGGGSNSAYNDLYGEPMFLDCVGYIMHSLQHTVADILGISMKDAKRAIPVMGADALLKQEWIYPVHVRDRGFIIKDELRPGDIILMDLQGRFDTDTFKHGRYDHMMVFAGKSAIAEQAKILQNNGKAWANTIGEDDDLFTTECVPDSTIEITRTANSYRYDDFRVKNNLDPLYTIARINWTALINYTKNSLGLP